MRIIILDAVLIVVAIISISATVCVAEEVKKSPHSDTGDCTVCHVAPVDKLRGWFVFGSTKRELNNDLNKLCQQCHTIELTHAAGSLDVGKGHATGKKPSLNRQNLPLASDGTINCATTCHNMHVAPDARQLQHKHLRLPVNALCMSCHNM